MQPVEDGYEAINPGQQGRTRFNGSGFIVEPMNGSWSWGLRLDSFGFDGLQEPGTQPECARSEGWQLTYEWSEVLHEWYINDARGLEHGYTVQRRPSSGAGQESGPLRLALSVQGTLQPRAQESQRGNAFVGDGAGSVLSYTGLVAFDADGVELECSIRRVGEHIELSVEEAELATRSRSTPLHSRPT